MHDHDHIEPPPADGRLLRSGISIKATADRATGLTRSPDETDVIDFVEVNVSVISAHPARVNLNAAAVAADAALRAQLDEPAEPVSDL